MTKVRFDYINPFIKRSQLFIFFEKPVLIAYILHVGWFWDTIGTRMTRMERIFTDFFRIFTNVALNFQKNP